MLLLGKLTIWGNNDTGGNMKNLLKLLALIGPLAFAQSSIVKAPRDAANAILYAGLGLPYLIQPALTNTAYDTSPDRTQLSTSGADTGRQYRHLWIYNPSATIGIYVCAGNASGCSTDMWYCPPGIGVVDDYAYFGAASNTGYLYYRLSGAGSVTPTLRWW